MQFLRSRFRCHCNRHNHDQICADRKQSDGPSQRDAGPQIAHKRRKERADTTAEVVREALSRTAQSRGKQLREKRAHGTERPGREKSQRKSERQHYLIADGEVRISRDRSEENTSELQTPMNLV